MHHLGFAIEQGNLPAAADPARVALGIERWCESIAASGDRELADFARQAVDDDRSRRLLEAVFGNSPFLTQCAVNEPALLRQLMCEGPDAAIDRIMEGLDRSRSLGLGAEALAPLLRQAKRRSALVIALADIAGAWSLERVTGALSGFAEAALSCAAACLLVEAQKAGALVLSDPTDPERGSGLVVLGVGKLGARELNYSSDVDLIVLFDGERIRSDHPEDLQKHFVRLTRNLVRLLEERTADGYVFRTDLRLRPDPGSTPVAISVLAAETYYESMGQNWERAALIKARPVAGDRDAGAAFLERLRPFVWRKNLDFAAIQDIHSIKRQINAHRGGAKIAVTGHDVKLGRGGIREIEFFVQTQQLIWGGRQPELRRTGTVDALDALAARGHIAGAAAEELTRAYRYLRRVEHRLQMVDDEQTHSVPGDGEGLRGFATFMGYGTADDFASELLDHLRRVESHYAALFENAPALSATGSAAGNLVFTGGDPDPETLATIEGMGYGNPRAVDAAVRGWHHGRYKAMRSARARELLTELVPGLLTAMSRTADPDAALVRFDEFLSRLPSGVQVFSMFQSNPHLLELVAEIVGNAPRLAEHLSRRPSVLDVVLDAGFFDPPPPLPELEAELDRMLARADHAEDLLNLSRRWANDRRFQVGVQSLRGHLAPGEAAMALSNVAEAALSRLMPRVVEDFTERHGRFRDSGMAVVAMGKLGGREMTPASDLDLIFIYTVSGDAEVSDGPRPLPPTQYFARLCQRLISSITAPTGEGRLYEVDMRLRPSGKAGPIASSLEAFVRYHRQSAWTWEHMALTRARVIAGPPDLCRGVEEEISRALTRPRDAEGLLSDVAGMRERMEKEHRSDFIWEVKHQRGGLIDVEFIAQYLELRYAHSLPAVLSPNTRTALTNLRQAGVLETAAAARLIEALDLWQGIQMILRLTIEGQFKPDREGELVPGLRELLARVGGAADDAALERKIRTVAGGVHDLFRELVEEPARDLAGAPSPGEA